MSIFPVIRFKNYLHNVNINNKLEDKLSPSTHFDSLPDELVSNIFKLLSLRDQDAAACVCKRWRIILEDKCGSYAK